jgi:hypothetical protein
MPSSTLKGISFGGSGGFDEIEAPVGRLRGRQRLMLDVFPQEAAASAI